MATRPPVPNTAVTARISGTEAATSAPKTMNRMISVETRVSIIERLSSSADFSASALVIDASPYCSMSSLA